MRKLAMFSAAFAVAALVYVYGLLDVRALWLAGAFLLCSAGGSALGLRRVKILSLGLCVGFLWCWAYHHVWLAPAMRLAGTTQVVTVQAETQPWRSTHGRMAVEVRLETEGRHYEAVLYADEPAQVEPGDWLTCEAEILPTGIAPGRGENVYFRSSGQCLLLRTEKLLNREPGPPTGPMKLRLWLQERLHTLYEGQSRGLLLALITGDRSELQEQTKTWLSVTGISHVVAVSGMHVSMLLALVVFFTRGNPVLTALLGCPLVVFFALMTGASPSVCRAAVMQILMICAPLARREYDPATTLSGAVLLLLLQNPWVIASVSFQMSVAAVAGLFLCALPIRTRLLHGCKHPGRLRLLLTDGVSATLGASLFTLPLTALYFGQISIVAPLTNVLVLWAVTLVFTLGLLSCLLGPAGVLLAWAVRGLSAYILQICAFLAGWPYAAAYRCNLPLMLWAASAYGLMLLVLLCKKPRSLRGPGALLLVSFCLCLLAGRWEWRADRQVTVLDVGQGQCMLLRQGDFLALVDCGGSYPEEAAEDMARYLHSAGITRVDAMILTHYDADHVGGAPYFLTRVQVDQIFLPPGDGEQALRAALEPFGSRIHRVETDTNLEFSGGKIQVYPPFSQGSRNDTGLTILASLGEYDILVTGDMDQEAELQLLNARRLPQVELLMAGHHGAASSTSGLLLDTVRPETVVISVGRNNSYGHPAPETLDRIRAAGAEIYRTDLDGTVVLEPEEG